MLTDSIADLFTRIRNAAMAKRRTVSVPASNEKKEIVRILCENGFVQKYAFVDDNKQGEIKILLKYDKNQKSAIQQITRVSKPSRRVYAGFDTIPKALNGMGITIVSTSRGLKTDSQCRKEHVGGEVLGQVY